MSVDILIRSRTLTRLDRARTDVTAIPDGATLIARAHWATLVALAGTEAALMRRLDVTDVAKAEVDGRP